MKTLERCVLKCADSDWTWMGLKWLRPAKHRRLGLGFVLGISALLGLPGLVLGVGLICLVFGRIDPAVALGLFAVVMMIEVPLNAVFAYYWNRRAKSY